MEKKDNNFYKTLQNAPFYLKNDQIDTLKDHIETLTFWDEVSSLPNPQKIWFFHPVAFLEHLEKVTEPDVKYILENMTPEDKLKVTYVGKIKLELANPAWEKAKEALDSSASSKVGKKSISDNMLYTLKNIIMFMRDQEIQQDDEIDKIYISSTYRNDNKYYPGHYNAIAVDLFGGWFDFTNEPFSKEKALKLAKILGRYNVKSILFNCPYVIDNARDVTVCGYHPRHHHHFHVDFGFERTEQRDDYLCYGKYKDNGKEISYYCINHPKKGRRCNYANKKQ